MKALMLWADVPPERRVDASYYRRFKRFGGPAGREYLERTLDRLEHPGCEVAVVAYSSGGRYQPCGMTVQPGSLRCSIHGGLSPTPLEKKRRRLWQRRESLLVRRHILELSLLDIDDEIAQLGDIAAAEK